MSGLPVIARLLTCVAVALLAACAAEPERPVAPAPAPAAAAAPPAAAADTVQTRAIALHRQLAQKHRDGGDLAAAAAQWQILTLLAPHNEAFRRELHDTRAAIERTVDAELDAARAALRRGDSDHATHAMLRVLALQPGHAEAAKALRDIERNRASRIQAERASRALAGEIAASARAGRGSVPAAAPPARDPYDLEQRIELFRAGDTTSGLRELKRYVDANPGDTAARAQIGATVYERAREVEAQGAREQAVVLYEQAIALRGEAVREWSARLAALRKALSADYYDKGMREAQPAQAITYWETSLRYDPGNKAAAAKLGEARRNAAPAKKGIPGS